MRLAGVSCAAPICAVTVVQGAAGGHAGGAAVKNGSRRTIMRASRLAKAVVETAHLTYEINVLTTKL